jgi:hypothetical protein
MSDDDGKPERDRYFTPSGKFAKGHPGFKGKQQQSDTSPSAAAPFEGNPDNPDDVIIYVSRNFGRKGLPLDGQIGYYHWLMKERPADFNAQHIKAVARRAEASGPSGGTYITQVTVLPVARHTSVGLDGTLISDAEAKAAWEERAGMKLDQPPAPLPPVQPVAVQPRLDGDDEEPEPSDEDPNDPQARLSKFRASAYGAFHVASLRPPPSELPPVMPIAGPPASPRRGTGVDMHSMLGSLPKTKWGGDEPRE